MQTDISSPNTLKLAVTDYPVHELIAQRWSTRAFAEQQVEPEKLRSMFEAARWAPSSGNGQPWSFLVATKEHPAVFGKMVDCLQEGNALWAAHAPVLGIVVAAMVRANGKPNRHAFYDTGLAVQNLVLQATALGLHLRQMGGFFPERAAQSFSIPAEHEAVAMFALGYLGDPATLSDDHRSQELTSRKRRPLTEFVFSDRWGDPAPLLEE